jgi:GcrA cell cycle regulator
MGSLSSFRLNPLIRQESVFPKELDENRRNNRSGVACDSPHIVVNCCQHTTYRVGHPELSACLHFLRTSGAGRMSGFYRCSVLSEETLMSWNDERVDLLKKLWSDGLSASQIAAELGGVTRNAVIGKVHRLGLSGRAKTPSSSVPRARKPAPRPAVRTVSMPQMRGNVALAHQTQVQVHYHVETRPAQEVVVPMSRRVQIMELKEAMCKWPMGDPTHAEFVFCGADCNFGTPYCTHHSAIAYQPAAERRRTR